jgi:hypothetical protein
MTLRITNYTLTQGRRRIEEISFFEDLKDQFDDFIHASLDQHINCFTNTINKLPLLIKLSLFFSFFFALSLDYGCVFFICLDSQKIDGSMSTCDDAKEI